MKKLLRTVVLIDSTGLGFDSVEESWRRLHIANPLHIVSSCTEAQDLISGRAEPEGSTNVTDIGALVLDETANHTEGLRLVSRVRSDPATASVPILIYAADLHALLADGKIEADAFVRRPMFLKLISELDSLLGLTKTPFDPAVESPRREVV